MNLTVGLSSQAHNLVEPLMNRALRKYLNKIHKLQGWLRSAKGSVVVGLTATPVSGSAQADEDENGRNQLLRIIQGEEELGSEQTEEGFVSFFNASPTGIFPQVIPNGVPTAALPTLIEVPLGLAMRQKYCQRLKQAHTGGRNATIACLPYLNTSTFFARTRQQIEANDGCGTHIQ